MPANRCRARILLWSSAAVAVLLSAAIVLGYLHPGALCRGPYAVGTDKAYLTLANSSVDLASRGPAWLLGPNTQIMVGPRSRWRPAVSGAMTTITDSDPNTGITSTSTTTLDVLYIPLAPWAVVFGALAGYLWWLQRKRILPGHCRACAYDLRGLTTDRCPECGKPADATPAAEVPVSG